MPEAMVEDLVGLIMLNGVGKSQRACFVIFNLIGIFFVYHNFSARIREFIFTNCPLTNIRIVSVGGKKTITASPDALVPSFAEPIQNVTVAAGREVVLPCVVDNLGSYRVS
ncbi:hypothetical protein NPIL_487901 [Nephila pilipes]|uniref:Ig-like domain-containing protein n=1 Tax=Nephila pilipes TaxID=299642 RepID=A0A8X6TLV2_NEPPI|nr:hypothetical protein NPIL_487901 [Nephila pilipes]